MSFHHLSVPAFLVPYVYATLSGLIATVVLFYRSYEKNCLKILFLAFPGSLRLILFNLLAVNLFYFGASWLLQLTEQLSNLSSLRNTVAFLFGLTLILYKDLSAILISQLEISPEQIKKIQQVFDDLIGFYGNVIKALIETNRVTAQKESSRLKDLEAQALKEKFSCEELQQLLKQRIGTNDNEFGQSHSETFKSILAAYPSGTEERTYKIISLVTNVFTQKEISQFVRKNKFENTSNVTSITFDQSLFIIDFEDGRRLSIPLIRYPRLLNASLGDRENYSISNSKNGCFIKWPRLNEQIAIKDLLSLKFKKN